MNIDHLCIAYDWATSLSENKSLTLIGDTDSPFLKSVARKARKLGVWCSLHFQEGRPTLVDKETAQMCGKLSVRQDIDCLDNPGLSCCAQAVRDVLSAIGVEGKSVCIIGRGHAVQGLAEVLTRMDATVTVCHSKTKNLYEATMFADILIVAAPVTPVDVAPTTGRLVIDLVGSFREAVKPELYIGDVGKLTTSIILHRAATR